MKSIFLVVLTLVLGACSSIQTRRSQEKEVQVKEPEKYNVYCSVQGLPIVEINAKLLESDDGYHKVESELGRTFIIPIEGCLLEKVIPGLNDGKQVEEEKEKSLMLPEVVPFEESQELKEKSPEVLEEK